MKNSAPKNSKHNDGPRHWRSLEHKADSPEFREFVEKEFPSGVDLKNYPSVVIWCAQFNVLISPADLNYES